MAFEWFRSWHGAPTDSKFLLIAKRAQVAPGMVSAVYWALLDYASQNEPRGSADGFDTETYAEWAGWEERDVIAIIAALTSKGAIVDGRIVAWEKRQPKKEDPGAAERMRKMRDAQRNASVTQTEIVTEPSVTPSYDVLHDVTPSYSRSDQIRSEDDIERRQALNDLQIFGLFTREMLTQFDDMWPELTGRRDWIGKAITVARDKDASTPSYALKVLANAIHTGKEPGYTNGKGKPTTAADADNRPRVPAMPADMVVAADARQAEYERQEYERLVRAGAIVA